MSCCKSLRPSIGYYQSLKTNVRSSAILSRAVISSEAVSFPALVEKLERLGMKT